MRSVASLILCLVVCAGFSQRPVTENYDRSGQKVAPEMAEYYVIGKKNKRGYFYDSLKTYYKNGQVKSIEIRDKFGNAVGNFESFYPDGRLKIAGRFEKKQQGLYKSYEDSSVLSIERFNDPSGKAQVVRWNGWIDGALDLVRVKGKIRNGLRDSVWTMYNESGGIFCQESWHAGDLIDGISFDSTGKEYYYKSVVVMPEPSEGDLKFYSDLSDEMQYPKEAQRRGIEGKVIVEVTIGKSGVISKPRVISGLGFGCDEEAVRVVLLSKAWKPALERGQLASRVIVIPFLFRLK